MKNQFLLLLLVATHVVLPVYSEQNADSLSVFKHVNLEEVVIFTSQKEQSSVRDLPLSSSIIDGKQADRARVTSIKEISSMIPNFYMPDYGSKLTSTIYIRGVGSRMSSSAVSLYVDDVPYIDKSSFDTELYDIESIEVLRGPQGTLFGRNSLGGVIHIHTRSPFTYKGTKLSVGGGNYGHLRTTLSRYGQLGEKVGYSVSAYYDGNDGFFTNRYTNKSADQIKSAGGRGKVAWQINSNWKSELSFGFDYVDQSGFPYGLYVDSLKRANPVAYNDECSYRRSLASTNLLLQRKGEKFTFTSITAYQYQDDMMRLDQDFTPANIFVMNQAQRINTVNQEFTLKSENNHKWQWVTGLAGYYQDNKTDGPVTFKREGLTNVIGANFPSFVQIKDSSMLLPGMFKMPSYSIGLYHQSTFNDLLTKGLSLTLGLRLEHENIDLDYFSAGEMNLSVAPPGMPRPIPYFLSDTISGKESVNYTQLLPKVAVQYQVNNHHTVYGTVSKGYKSGGYNFQMFSDIIQEALRDKMPMGGSGGQSNKNYGDRISYKPEFNWNYEVGYRGDFFNGRLQADVALFYIDIRDQQITQFAPNGFGRMARNAARSTSKGVELSVAARPVSGLTLGLNYGFTHATFSEYTNGVHPDSTGFVDFKGKYVPLAPKNTFSLSADYQLPLPKNNIVDRVSVWGQYAGNGRIYWTEENNRYQDFYGLVNAKLSLSKSIVRVDLWAKNILAADYQTFYFQNMGQHFVQTGRPTQVGVDLVVSF